MLGMLKKFYTAGVIRVQFLWQSTGPIIGIREPTPLRNEPSASFINSI